VSDAADLGATTLAWSMPWWDPAEHMVWNPPASLTPAIEARQLHLVPNTAWLAYALLASGDAPSWTEGLAAIRALLALQYDRPGTVVHGTYRRFLEWPEPPAEPVMWDDYDPNWRQFVGTTLAVILEDFSDRLDAETIAAIEHSIGLACAGEPDGRIPPSYSNPALMRAWLDAWYGRRTGDDARVERGRSFAAEIIAAFDRFGAFDEFNSPTYYGIDLYALRLWRTFPPEPYFAREGERLENALWTSAAAFYNANLRNFCGPFTRSYDPDATCSVSLFSLWIWAILGRDLAPLPALDAPAVDHGHDLMAGPLFARLAGGPTAVDLGDFRDFRGERFVEQSLAGRRRVTAWVGSNLMVGAESGPADWGGWEQFLPATAHWRTELGAAALWLTDAHVVHATASERGLVIDCPGAAGLRFLLSAADAPVIDATTLQVAGMRVTFTGTVSALVFTAHRPDRYELRTVPVAATATDATVELRFFEV
jgi:hypothetical protein